MPEARPAYSRDSVLVRIPDALRLGDLSPERAWGGATGRNVRVAVVDSGVEADHPDLEGCVDVAGGVRIKLDEGGQPVEVAGPHGDDFGHGTAVSGIIHSLAPEARITSVKVLGAGLTGRAGAMLRGIAWAVERRFDVINLSLGTTRRDWRGTGNSYAAPHISGLAALILSKHPRLLPFQVKTVLWATAANVRESAPLAQARTARMTTASSRASRLTTITRLPDLGRR